MHCYWHLEVPHVRETPLIDHHNVSRGVSLRTGLVSEAAMQMQQPQRPESKKEERCRTDSLWIERETGGGKGFLLLLAASYESGKGTKRAGGEMEDGDKGHG